MNHSLSTFTTGVTIFYYLRVNTFSTLYIDFIMMWCLYLSVNNWTVFIRAVSNHFLVILILYIKIVGNCTLHQMVSLLLIYEIMVIHCIQLIKHYLCIKYVILVKLNVFNVYWKITIFNLTLFSQKPSKYLTRNLAPITNINRTEFRGRLSGLQPRDPHKFGAPQK